MLCDSDDEVIIEQVYAKRSIKQKLLNEHSIDWYEVEEAMAQSKLQPKRTGTGPDGQRRYYVESGTEVGRRLFIVFTVRSRRADIITAYQID